MICKECGAEFDGRKRIFCTRKCREKYHSRKTNAQYIKYWDDDPAPRVEFADARQHRCPVCGEQFIPAPYHAYQVKGKPLCSYRCYVQALEVRQ